MTGLRMEMDRQDISPEVNPNAVPGSALRFVLTGWIRIAIVFLLLAGGVYLLFFRYVRCIDGCGPYHNTSSVADLDNDGDLDVVLANLRHETETIIWAGPTLWINQGNGRFTPRRVEMGGPSSATGDIDGDGDVDIVQMDYNASIYLNQGGEQGGNRR